MKTTLLLIIAVFAFNCSFGQEADSIIYWGKNVKLKWDDFKGEPELSSNKYSITPKAMTAAILNAIPIEKEWGYSYTVINYFLKTESWAKDTLSSQLLIHEQIHFDIAEVYARKMRKCIHELEMNKEKDVNKYLEIIDKLMYELNLENKLYDKETFHGVSNENQEKWTEKILNKLKELDEYEVDYLKLLE